MNRAIYLLFPVSMLIMGCATPQGSTGTDKRQAIQDMRQDALARLYAEKPQAKSEIESAPGYAVFSNVGVSCLFAGAGDGYGIVVDRAAGKETYMRMAQVSAELGVGLKDFRAVFVFHDPVALHRFEDEGWQVGAEADADVKSRDKGSAAGAAVVIDQPTRLYQFTQAGVVLRVGIPLAKYWRYEELN